MFNRAVKYFLDRPMLACLFLFAFIGCGISFSPFEWHSALPRNPIAVDAIPDIGENQQIVATEWTGRSPKDIQEQVTYPLTAALLGLSDVKSIRSTSMFGMSFIYIIFNDKADFYWCRSRILEKLNSLPSGTLPANVAPALGPDATALGQVFWYTLEGRNPKTGEPAGGWSPQELRTIQDFYVKHGLASAEGVAEVASAGGFVKEYQADINPAALKAYDVSMGDVMNAMRKCNLDIGAETIELNKAEYIVRGLGYVKSLEDLENTVVTMRNHVPVRIKDVAHVLFGPAARRGGLDKEGAEAVGAAAVARYGSNPLQVINNIKDKIKEIAPGLPQKQLDDGSISKVTVIPFYDRSHLIKETIGTLETALSHEILISIIVIVVLVLNLRASFIVAALLPVGVLMTFIFMRLFGVEANIMALSGIAIAIGVMADIGIVDVENILRHLEMPENKGARGKKLRGVIYRAVAEVRDAVVTSIATTVVGFLPVFAMESAEGKLFHPLAYAKTFALIAAFLLGIIVLPVLTYLFFNVRLDFKKFRKASACLLILAGILLMAVWHIWTALALVAIGINNLIAFRHPGKRGLTSRLTIGVVALAAVYYLSVEWLPLGPSRGILLNFLFVAFLAGSIIGALWLLIYYYELILTWALAHKVKFLLLPMFTLCWGLLAWIGFARTFNFLAEGVEKVGWKTFKETAFWENGTSLFPGLGKEFMPSLNEGSFLLMPSSMPHAGVEKSLEYIKTLDRRLASIPEVEIAVGKWGRAQSALDPAPVQMFENIVNYRSEYILDEEGRRERFRMKDEKYVIRVDSLKSFALKKNYPDVISKIDEMNFDLKKHAFLIRTGKKWETIDSSKTVSPYFNLSQFIYRNIGQYLTKDPRGEFFRQWRNHIKSSSDVWREIEKATSIPGLTSSPKLQPIETRLIMLSTGMRAPMGIKVFAPDLETIEAVGIQFEKILREVPSVHAASVFYDRAAGAPYLEIALNREAMAHYGMSIAEVQEILEAAVGGKTLNQSVEGRERFPMRVRYARELRNNPEELKNILIPNANNISVSLGEIADIRYTRGAQMIRSENTFLTGYVIFDKIEGPSETDVVEEAKRVIESKIHSGELQLPAGTTYKFAGNYEHQVRAAKKLAVVIPVSLLIILLLLYFQFKTMVASLIHFSGVFVAFAGGFIMLWLYGQDWFFNFSVVGVPLRSLFQMHAIHLSVAVWVGFLALFGIAANDGVIMGTYIHQVFEKQKPSTAEGVRRAVLEAGKKRVRPAMMTAAVAVIALLPVLSAAGKGADIMVPMAIPVFGGMIIQLMTIFVVPVLQSAWREYAVQKNNSRTKIYNHEK